MNRKIVLALACVFAVIMGASGVLAITNQSIPIPIKISLVPTYNFQFTSITYAYNLTQHRHTSANVTVQNISPTTRNCTVQVYFYQDAISIAYGTQQILNINSTKTKSGIVTLTWSSGKNLTHVTSGDLIIY